MVVFSTQRQPTPRKIADADNFPDRGGRRKDTDRGKVFCVRDNGIGFDMHSPTDCSRSSRSLHGREFEGTGIGLATVKRIIDRLCGEVWVDSAPGKGAAFFYSLPESNKGDMTTLD